jgi:hypothetical protein
MVQRWKVYEIWIYMTVSQVLSEQGNSVTYYLWPLSCYSNIVVSCDKQNGLQSLI